MTVWGRMEGCGPTVKITWTVRWLRFGVLDLAFTMSSMCARYLDMDKLLIRRSQCKPAASSLQRTSKKLPGYLIRAQNTHSWSCIFAFTCHRSSSSDLRTPSWYRSVVKTKFQLGVRLKSVAAALTLFYQRLPSSLDHSYHIIISLSCQIANQCWFAGLRSNFVSTLWLLHVLTGTKCYSSRIGSDLTTDTCFRGDYKPSLVQVGNTWCLRSKSGSLRS